MKSDLIDSVGEQLANQGVDATFSSQMPNLVKGYGYKSGVKPLDAQNDSDKIFDMARRAEKSVRAATKATFSNTPDVIKGLPSTSPFKGSLGLSMQRWGGGVGQLVDQLNQMLSTELGKSITLTSPLATSFAPFDLVAPSRLIYPVYTPMRNKIPRVPGQGVSRQAKVLTGVMGSQTPSGSNGPQRISISELTGGSLPTWPLNLPASGSQTAVDVNIPYKFLGLTEAISWLAQFSGQGFEDISALINLVLLQEMMLGEEYQMLFGTKSAVPVPAAPVVALRTAGTNETAVAAPGGGNSYYIRITATNVFGETTMSNAGEAAIGAVATDVIDLTLNKPRGGVQNNIYISLAQTAGGYAGDRTHYFLQAANVGATRFTIQGTLAGSGTNPPAADSTAGANDFEGFTSILDGHSVTDASVYPSGFQGGYINSNVNDTLNLNVISNALMQVFDGPQGAGYRADPAEIICEGSDAKNLGDALAASSGNAGYRFFITQAEPTGVRAGAAVSEFVNPITRNIVRIMVHPFFPQGVAYGMSYQLPATWTNIANAFEMTMVQDYLSIAWPVIDATFRYSIFAYGALVGTAPQYSFILKGLQRSTATPYS